MRTRSLIAIALLVAALNASCDRSRTEVPAPAITVVDTAAPQIRTDSVLPNVPDSVPRPSYADLPGWFVPSLVDVSMLTDSVTGEDYIFRLRVFPQDDRWGAVPVGATLQLLTARASVTARVQAVHPRGDQGGNRAGASELELHAPGLNLPIEYPIVWILPESVAGVQGIPVEQYSTADTARSWRAEAARLFLVRRSAQTAELLAQPPAGEPVRILDVRADPDADRAMGVDPDSTLDFNESNGRIPEVLAAYRFGADGPWIFVLLVSGYECSNFHLVRVDQRTARMISEGRHYYSCAH